jgi:hypothetical protein
MDIGTAKPSAEELAGAPHHLIDIIDPLDAYSVAQFRADTLRLVAQIAERGRLPLLVGGTMMYFKGLVAGLDDLPTADAAVRAALEEEAARIGWPAMHAQLRAVDPVTANRLAPNDAQRINRALEIYRLSGQPMSALLARAAPPELPFDLVSFGLEPTAPCCTSASRSASTRCWASATTPALLPRWPACAHAATCIRTCRRCAASATASPGTTWMAASTARPCAKPASSPPASSRNAS